MGRPVIHPQDEIAQKVQFHVAMGTPQEIIARILGVSTKTLHHHYKHQLETGRAEANFYVMGHLMNAIKGGSVQAMSLYIGRFMKDAAETGEDQAVHSLEDIEAKLKELPLDQILALENAMDVIDGEFTELEPEAEPADADE